MFSVLAGRRLASGPPAEAGPASLPRAPRFASPRPSPAPRLACLRAPAPRRAPDRVRACPPRGATRRRRPDTASTRRGSSGTAGHGLSSRRARPASHFLLLLPPLARQHQQRTRHRPPLAPSPDLARPSTTAHRRPLHLT